MNRPQKPRNSKAKPTLHLARCERCGRPALKVRGRVSCLRCGDSPLFEAYTTGTASPAPTPARSAAVPTGAAVQSTGLSVA